MKPKVKGNDIEVLVIEPVFITEVRDLKINGKRVKDPEGHKLREQRDKFVKEVYLKTWMNRNDISIRSEYIGTGNNKLKTRSRIYNKITQEFYNVAHSLEEINKALTVEIQPMVGFKPQENEI